MKQFIFMMRRHGLPMIAAAASSSVLTWMMCDLENSKRRQQLARVQPTVRPEDKKENHEWHGS